MCDYEINKQTEEIIDAELSSEIFPYENVVFIGELIDFTYEKLESEEENDY